MERRTAAQSDPTRSTPPPHPSFPVLGPRVPVMALQVTDSRKRTTVILLPCAYMHTHAFMPTIKPGTPIRRRDEIPPGDRTEKRDKTAEVIEEMWDSHNKTEIAEAAEVSRTHVDNVLERYFERVDPSEGDAEITGEMEIERRLKELREDGDFRAIKLFLDGYIAAVEDLSDGEAEVGAASVEDLVSDGGSVVS